MHVRGESLDELVVTMQRAGVRHHLVADAREGDDVGGEEIRVDGAGVHVLEVTQGEQPVAGGGLLPEQANELLGGCDTRGSLLLEHSDLLLARLEAGMHLVDDKVAQHLTRRTILLPLPRLVVHILVELLAQRGTKREPSQLRQPSQPRFYVNVEGSERGRELQ